MMSHKLFCIVWLAWLGFAVGAIAQDDVDCTRYRAAGLPCLAKPAASSTRTPEAVQPPVRLQGLPGRHKPAVPLPALVVSPARDASGASLAAPSPVRVLSAVVPASSPTVMTSVPLFATLPTTPLATPAHALTPLAGVTAPLTASLVSAPDNHEPGQLIVYWSSLEDADAALAVLARDRLTQPVSSSRLDHLGGVVAVFQLKNQAEANDLRNQLVRDFPGLAVDFNTRYRPLQQAKPRIYLPLKIDLPQPSDAWPVTTGIRVGIVDGPVTSIAALANNKIIRKSFLMPIDTAASAEHATSVAALISGQDQAAGFLGVAPQVSLYSAEIMRSAGQSDFANSNALVRALDWLLSEKVQVINLSLGGPGDAVMAKAFTRLAEMAVVTVAAAGNGGLGAAPAYPAAYPGVIAVTATDALDNAYSLANQGAYIALAAPGVDLWVPDAGVGHYVSGTSFSAAVVTAASAWLLAYLPQLNAKSLRHQLCRTAKDLGAKGLDPVFGCGLIQIGAAMRDDRS